MSPGETARALEEETQEKEAGLVRGTKRWRFRQRSEMTSQACGVQSNEIQ